MKNLILTFALSIMTIFTFGQNAINYQGVCSTASGEPVANKTINVLIDIIDSTEDGPIVYSETHLVETNGKGLFSLEIGNGDSDTTYQTFDMINFASPTFMSIEVDITGGDTSFVYMGTSQFLSVPNALYSQRAGEVLTKEIDANNYTLTLTVDANIDIELKPEIENTLLRNTVQVFVYDASGDLLINTEIVPVFGINNQYSFPSDSPIYPNASKFVFYFETINGLQRITHPQ